MKESDIKFEKRVYSKDSYYEGESMRLLKHGQGKMVYSQNSYYEGQFYFDNRSGKGKHLHTS